MYRVFMVVVLLLMILTGKKSELKFKLLGN